MRNANKNGFRREVHGPAADAHPVVARFQIGLVALGIILASSPIIFRDHVDWFSWAIGGFAAITLLASHGRMRVSASLIAFAAWAVVSVIWTFDKTGSANGLASLVATLIAGFALATFGTRVVARGLLVGETLAVFSSLLVGVVLPERGRSVEFGGAFIGIYSHRNFLASVTVIGLALAIAFASNASTRARRFWYVVVAGMFACTGVLTLSGSAIVISVAVAAGAMLLWFMRSIGPWGRAGTVPLLLVGMAASVVVVLPRIASELAGLVGRNLTLTGRTDIWAIVLAYSAQRPALGYGWGGSLDGRDRH